MKVEWSVTFRAILAIVLIVNLIMTLLMLAFEIVVITEANQRLVDNLVQTNILLATISVQWWFGSSKGSADKTDLIKNGGPT